MCAVHPVVGCVRAPLIATRRAHNHACTFNGEDPIMLATKAQTADALAVVHGCLRPYVVFLDAIDKAERFTKALLFGVIQLCVCVIGALLEHVENALLFLRCNLLCLGILRSSRIHVGFPFRDIAIVGLFLRRRQLACRNPTTYGWNGLFSDRWFFILVDFARRLLGALWPYGGRLAYRWRDRRSARWR